MRTINHSLILFSLAITCGLVWGNYFPDTFSGVVVASVFLVLLIITWLWNQRHPLPNWISSVGTFLAFFCIGYGNFQQKLPQFQTNHYLNQRQNDRFQVYQVQIRDVLKPSTYHNKYLAEVQSIGPVSSQGVILLNLEKDSLEASFRIDETLWIYTKVSEIKSPLNPYQFDYKKYMASLGVFGELTFQKKQILSSHLGRRSLRGYAGKFRNYLVHQLKNTLLENREREILQALILGEKRVIDKDLYKQYAAAGAVHILAVSGLHVGILLFIFHALLRPLQRLPKGKFIKAFLILVLLWGFAFMAGLSPSVVRAVTMFSFLSISLAFQRKQSTYNTLLMSYFVLLLFQPLWLFQVGFQLSYLAVFFIIWIQPMMTQLYRPRNKLLRYFWNLTTVSLAAQIGVAPLSIYYFHQFPGLFFLTNLLILPFLGVLLSYGILVLCLAGLGENIFWLEKGLQLALQNMNDLIIWIASHNRFVFESLSLSFEKMILSYAFTITLVLFWKTRNRQWTFSLLSIIILSFAHTLWTKWSPEESLIVFHKTRNTLIATVTSEEIILLKKDSLISVQQEPLRSFFIQKDKPVRQLKFSSVWKHEKHTYIVLDSLGVYPSVKGAVLLFTDSPKVNLERMIDSLKPLAIIADGSNYKSYVERWKYTCQKRQIPFHSTYNEGAYIVFRKYP